MGVGNCSRSRTCGTVCRKKLAVGSARGLRVRGVYSRRITSGTGCSTNAGCSFCLSFRIGRGSNAVGACAGRAVLSCCGGGGGDRGCSVGFTSRRSYQTTVTRCRGSILKGKSGLMRGSRCVFVAVRPRITVAVVSRSAKRMRTVINKHKGGTKGHA